MKTRHLIAIVAMFFAIRPGNAQNQEETDSLVQELQEVVVTAKQPATRLVGTTLVTTIPGTNLADLGNALDVLARLPMLKVQDNTVSVIGKSNIEIYINGRPMRDDVELRQILSSNLKKVELLMAPGAAYASSTGAVLKITTSQNFIRGLSLTDQLQVQRGRKWSAMDNLSLSYHTGKWEMFSGGVINRNRTVMKGTTTNTLLYNGQETEVGGSRHNTYPTLTGSVNAGFNYASGTQYFGANYRFNPERGDFANTGSEWYNQTPAIHRDIDRRIRAHSHLASLYYENTFADKYLLHFDGDFKRSVQDNTTATTYSEADTDDVNSSDNKETAFGAAKLYLRFPFGKGDFTLGTQDSYTQTSLDYRMLNEQVGQYIPSSLTATRQTSAALFASWARMFGKLSLSTGLRYEYVDFNLKINGKRDGNPSRRDHLLTPDVSLSYAFSEEAQISLSCKMATEKPPYSQLTGALNYVGLHEIEGGNPALRDAKTYDTQLFGMWNGFMLQANFTRSADTYGFVKEIYPAPTLQLLMHPVNFDVSTLNLYFIWSKPVRCWTPYALLGMYRQWLTLDGTRYDKPTFSYYLNNVFTLPRGWTITANMSGRTQGDMHTNRFAATAFMMDASVGKTLFKKALTVKLAAADIFNTANNDWTMRTHGVLTDKRQSYDHRNITLNVIYNFQPRKSNYKGASAAEEEMNRL